MKHTLPITAILVLTFFVAQVVGLFITNAYYNPQLSAEQGEIVFEELPLGFERPEPQGAAVIPFMIVAVLVGTGLMLLLIRWNAGVVIKFWFLFAVALTSIFALFAFLNATLAVIIGGGLALWRIFKPNVWVQNITELFLYGGLAAIFVPFIGTVQYASILLILISLYDMYAVWKSKHMIKLAEYQSKSEVFAGLLIPYKFPKKIKNVNKKTTKATAKVSHAPVKMVSGMSRIAVLGGGDIGFPLLFSGVVLTQVGLPLTLIVSACATIALALLLYKSKEGRYYPAMPFLSIGCFVGYGLLILLR